MSDIVKPWLVLYRHQLAEGIFENKITWFTGTKKEVIERVSNRDELECIVPVDHYIEIKDKKNE